MSAKLSLNLLVYKFKVLISDNGEIPINKPAPLEALPDLILLLFKFMLTF